MPIRVSCQCGQSFAAPDHLAGKRVKCPKCAQPLAIPAAAPAGSAPAKQAPAKQPAKQKQPAAAPADDPFGDLNLAPPTALPPRDIFSEAGMDQRAAGTTPCPSCGKPLADTAVLCVKCGFHRQLGKKLAAAASSAASVAGHGDGGSADMLLQRAARAIDEAKEEELKTRSQGMPAWAYALMLLGLMLVAAVFITTGIGVGFILAGVMGLTAVNLASLYYSIRILIHAFNTAPIQGVLTLFVPFYIFYYVYKHWDAVGTFFLMNIYCGLIGSVCYGVMIMGAWIKSFEPEKEEASRNHVVLVIYT